MYLILDDLRVLNGAETPFGQNGVVKGQKELVRVYKVTFPVFEWLLCCHSGHITFRAN